MDINLTDWAEAELGTSQLGDARRTKRLVQLAEQRAAQPTASIPQACGDAAATKAAYRFYANADFPPQAILTPHRRATEQRVAQEQLVLAVQDTTILDYTHHPATQGLGVLNDEFHRGLLVHTTLAVTPQRVPLGLLHQQVWTRAAKDLGKRHARRTKPVAEKESQKWLTSLTATAAVQQRLPQVRLVSVGDREADVYDLFLLAQQLSQALLIRAAWDRRIAHPEGHLWAYLESRPVAGQLTLTVPRRPAQPARRAELTLRYTQVTLCPPHNRHTEKLPTLTVWAVLAQEAHPPAGVDAISWLLLTTVAIESFADACARVQWYTCRWVIELFHKVLKSGCRIEARQFEKLERLQRYLALDTIVAWRILFLTMLGRTLPELPCTAILEAHEWQALYCFIHHTATPPAEPPSLREATRWIAQLGGFVGRKSDGTPGVTVMWRGLQRLNDIATTWQVAHSQIAAT